MDPAVGPPEPRTVELDGIELVVTYGTDPKRTHRERVTGTVRTRATTDRVSVSTVTPTIR
jgi:hypothetical protein